MHRGWQVRADDVGDWTMMKYGENEIHSSDARDSDLDRKNVHSNDSSSEEANTGKDLEEFLRAVYRAQRGLASA